MLIIKNWLNYAELIGDTTFKGVYNYNDNSNFLKEKLKDQYNYRYEYDYLAHNNIRHLLTSFYEVLLSAEL